MRFDRYSRQLILTALMLGTAGGASAQSNAPDTLDRGFYVSADVGPARYPKPATINAFGVEMRSRKFKNDDVRWNVSGGYRYNKYFAVEAGYQELGRSRISLVDVTGNVVANLGFSTRGGILALVGLLPFDSGWEIFVKGGGMLQDSKLRLKGWQGGVPFEFTSEAHNEVGLYVAGGVSYRFDQYRKVSLGFNYFPDVGDEARTGTADVRSGFVSIACRF